MNDQETVEQAIEHHLNGRAERAANAYRRILAADPVEPTALHYYGIYLHQHGQHDEALEMLELASILAPDNAEWFNNTGNVLFALARYAPAADAYQAAAALAQSDVVVWNNLGATRLQLGQTAEATSSFLRAVEINPEFGPALQHLGAIYLQAGDKMKGSYYECSAYVLPPLEGKSKEMLGISFYFLGRLDEAAQIYRAWLEEAPDNPIAEHMLAACSQQDVPLRASDGYIEQHFDRYADTFDRNLKDSLAYRGPDMIGAGLNALGPPARQFSMVDIGCGTGLCGPVLAPYSRHLTGVDLAGKMLQKAADGGHYDLLVKAEIGDYLATSADQVDVVAGADTMIYFGDLEPVFRLVADRLHPGGYFIFTIEVFDPLPAGAPGYLLHASGRYRHGHDYVLQRLAQFGLHVIHDGHDTLRQEVGEEVAGMVFVAQKRK